MDRQLLDSVKKQPCCICYTMKDVDPSHIRTRGSGGPDLPWNVFPKCRRHHNEWGQSWSKFLENHPHFAQRLWAVGWRIEDGKLWHDGLRTGP